jgi:hypothetical protein
MVDKQKHIDHHVIIRHVGYQKKTDWSASGGRNQLVTLFAVYTFYFIDPEDYQDYVAPLPSTDQ